MLKGIDLELQPGSRTVIVGGNGSGKSTLLRIGAGVSWPNDGNLILPERVGYVPERLAARTKIHGSGVSSHMGRIKGPRPEVIKTPELGPPPTARSSTPVATSRSSSLSKGNRQKLVLAQAFLAPAGLLVLDEPFSGLDPIAHVALGELMDEAQSTGTAVLAQLPSLLLGLDRAHQLRIQGGHLVEINHDEDLVTQNAHGWRCNSLRRRSVRSTTVAASQESRHTRLEEPRRLLVLLTDHLQIDGVLIEAIAQGWSVRSVRDLPRSGVVSNDRPRQVCRQRHTSIATLGGTPTLLRRGRRHHRRPDWLCPALLCHRSSCTAFHHDLVDCRHH